MKRVKLNLSARFTLIELLVVIAIISILASLLLPTLKRARESAKAIQCGSQLKQMSVAHFGYTGDYDGYFTGWGLGQPADVADRWTWYANIAPYLGIKSSSIILSDVKAYEKLKIFKCPSDPTTPLNDPRFKLSYGVSGGKGGVTSGVPVKDLQGPCGYSGRNDWEHVKVSSVRAPSRTILESDLWKDGKSLDRIQIYYVGVSYTEYQSLTYTPSNHLNNLTANITNCDGSLKREKTLLVPLGEFTVRSDD
jgi:prepilin-type N-terminal cleavage/methylation domain-containing protein